MRKGNYGINLQGLSAKGGNYRAIYTSNNFISSKGTIFNLDSLNKIFAKFQKKENVKFINQNQISKLLDNLIKIYLQNIIQELIEHHRRRTYSNYVLFSKHNRIISYSINVQRDPDPIINEKKNKLFPQKNLVLMSTINIDKKLELLDKYNNVKKDNRINEISPQKEKEKEIKDEENSENSDSDFFQSRKRKKIDEADNKSNDSKNNDKNNYLGILNVHQSHELTTNKLYAFKKFRMSKIELKDLVFYLEENQNTPMNKQLLYKAYIDMTIPNINDEQKEEDKAEDSI